jgi:hypothetical protein
MGAIWLLSIVDSGTQTRHASESDRLRVEIHDEYLLTK